jgi:hypothetical protein
MTTGMFLRNFLPVAWTALLGLAAASCAADEAPTQSVPGGVQVRVEPPMQERYGQAVVWLRTSEPEGITPWAYERTTADIQGVVTAAEEGRAAQINDLRPFHSYTFHDDSRVLTIRTDAGHDWKLGYRIERPDSLRNRAPDLSALIGQRVRLLFRGLVGHGTAEAFVLFDDSGVRFAMNRAVWGDAFLPGDLPGITVEAGRVVRTTSNTCVDSLNHMSMVVTGDQPLNLAPDAQGTFTAGGARYNALNVASFEFGDGYIRCSDLAPWHIWALWRER